MSTQWQYNDSSWHFLTSQWCIIHLPENVDLWLFTPQDIDKSYSRSWSGSNYFAIWQRAIWWHKKTKCNIWKLLIKEWTKWERKDLTPFNIWSKPTIRIISWEVVRSSSGVWGYLIIIKRVYRRYAIWYREIIKRHWSRRRGPNVNAP